jgi:hypothetical protein
VRFCHFTFVWFLKFSLKEGKKLKQSIKVFVPFGGLHPGDGHGGKPCSEKSLSFRYEMVSLMMDALSSWDVIAAGRGSILANS